MEFNKLTEIPNLHQIKLVEQQLNGIVLQTPLQYASELSSRFGANIFLKREDLQVVRSYKIRGAFHKIVNLPSALRGVNGWITQIQWLGNVSCHRVLHQSLMNQIMSGKIPNGCKLANHLNLGAPPFQFTKFT